MIVLGCGKAVLVGDDVPVVVRHWWLVGGGPRMVALGMITHGPIFSPDSLPSSLRGAGHQNVVFARAMRYGRHLEMLDR